MKQYMDGAVLAVAAIALGACRRLPVSV